MIIAMKPRENSNNNAKRMLIINSPIMLMKDEVLSGIEIVIAEKKMKEQKTENDRMGSPTIANAKRVSKRR